jgi:hypothetical protein
MIITVSPSRPILSHDLLGPPRQAQDSEEPRSLGTMLWFAIRGLGQADANTSRMATEDCHEPHGCHAALAHVLERALPTKWRHPEIRPVSPRPLIGLGAKPISSRFAILFVLRPVPSSHAQTTRPKTQDPRPKTQDPRPKTQDSSETAKQLKKGRLNATRAGPMETSTALSPCSPPCRNRKRPPFPCPFGLDLASLSRGCSSRRDSGGKRHLRAGPANWRSQEIRSSCDMP